MTLRLLIVVLVLGLGGTGAAAQADSAEVLTVWPLSDLNQAGDELGMMHLGQRLIYLRQPTSERSRRARRWRRRYGRAPSEWRLAELEGDGSHADRGPAELLDEGTSGLEGLAALSEDSLNLYLAIAVPAAELRGRRARRARREQLFIAERGVERFNRPRLAPFNQPRARSMHPTVSPDGRTLVFASDRTGGQGGLDLWAVRQDGDLLWGEAFNLGPQVNSPADDAYPAFDGEGRLFFASRRVSPSGQAAPGDTLADYDLFRALPSATGYTAVSRLPEPLNSVGDDVSLRFAADGRSGTFSSTRAEGAGGLDLYGFTLGARILLGPDQLVELSVVDAEGGQPVPEAAVRYVNTSSVSLARARREGMLTEAGRVATERGALLLPDSSGLVSWEAQPGYYATTATADGYEELDTSFVVNADPVSLRLPLRRVVPCAQLSVAVLDAESRRPVLGAEVSWQADAQHGMERPAESGRVGEGGTVDLCLPCGEVYGLVASGPSGRGSRPTALDLRGAECEAERRQTALTMYLGGDGAGPAPSLSGPLAALAGELTGAQAGGSEEGEADIGPARALGSEEAWSDDDATIIALPSVRYDYGSALLGKEARSDLGHLAEIMRDNVRMRVTLGSHTDAQGSRAFNAKLSGRRAAEAARFLTQELGVQPARVRAVGYGESQLLNDCRDGVPCTPAEHRVNRRTEIAVTGVDDPARLAELLARRAAEAEASGYADVPPARGGRAAAVAVEVAAPAEYEPAPRYRPDVVVDPARPYWVIAGTFRRDDYAERRRRVFEDLGYAGVEVVRFDQTARRGVVVGKFASLGEARQFSRAVVEAHRMAAYVRRVE